jgi:hypothetical protein
VGLTSVGQGPFNKGLLGKTLLKFEERPGRVVCY